jgi:hypothetical protein
MGLGYYILKGKKVVPVNTVQEWGAYFETSDRIIGKDIVRGYRVSTVFLGLDHSFGGGPPLLFETMIFDDKGTDVFGYQERYSTYKGAEQGHKAAIDFVKRLVFKVNEEGAS